MKIWIEEYGRIAVSAFCCVCLLGILFSGFLFWWKEALGVRDSVNVKTNFDSNEPRRVSPVFCVTDFKVKKGEGVDFTPYVSAVDFDGRNISRQIEILEEGSEESDAQIDGKSVLYQNMVTGCKGRVWEKQGIFHFVLRVKSTVTGKVTRGKVTVLVDFPKDSERRGVS